MKIGTLFGVNIFINKFTLLFIFLFIILGHYNSILTAFFIVFIHEMAHVVAAKMYRLYVSEIELLPFGGVVRIESFFHVVPTTEIVIALAGPLMNILLVFTLVLLDSYDIINSNSNFNSFIYGNLILGMFNLLPALPLDGGRVFRALLYSGIGYKKATNIAIVLSRLIATGLFISGLYIIFYKGSHNFVLLILSVYLFVMAGKEQSVTPYIYVKGLTHKKDRIQENKIMNVRHIVLPDSMSLKDIIGRFIPNKYHIAIIVDEDGDVIGSISESSLLKAVLKYGLNASVSKLIKNKKKEL